MLDFLQLRKIRKDPCARQAHIIHVHQIKTSVKEQIRCIRAIRVSLNACGRREAMTTRKLKYQWIKIWGKMDNDIFFLFCLLMFYLPVNAQEPSGSFAQAQK